MKDLFNNNDRFFEELFGFRRDFDQMFNRILTQKPWGQDIPALRGTYNFAPAIESFVDKDAKKYVCRVSLPGVAPKDVHILTRGDMLTIRGERKLTRSTKEVELYAGEIIYGSFERTFALPEGLVTDKLNAEYENGVLEITAPVAAAALPRKIEIRTVPFSKQIAA
jgi:HSP20 family protein